MDQYWFDWWNRLDGFVVIFSLIGFFFEMFAPDWLNVIRILRACRVIRIVRLLRMSWMVGCLRLLETLIFTLPALFNVGAMLFLVLFIYTTLGMAFYGDVPINPAESAVFNDYPYQMYNEHCNFRDFKTGFLLLFRMSTGESWNGVMHDVMITKPSSWIFFVSYMMIVAFIMFNLLIAVVLEQFATVMKQDNATVSPQNISDFAHEWSRFDPEARSPTSALTPYYLCTPHSTRTPNPTHSHLS